MNEPASLGTFAASVTFPEGGLPIWADLRVGLDGIHIQLRDGRDATLRYDDMDVDAGGLEAEVVICRSRSEGYAVQCSDPGFVEAIRGHGHPEVVAHLGKVDAKVRRHRRRRRAGVAVGALLVVGCALLFWYTPAILAATATSLPISVDAQIGDSAMGDLEASLGPRMNDPTIQAFLDQVIARLEPHASERGFDFRIHAIDSPEVNAFALPGGQMVVMRGLLAEAGGPEEVAGVLAHEMAHVTERHGLQSAAHGAGRWIALMILIGDDSALVGLAGEAASYANGSAYSREAEAEADAEGVRLMAAAGLDPRALAGFFRRLKARSGSELTGVANWLSSHPEHDARIAHVNEVAAEVPAAPRQPLPIDWAAVQAAAR